jgi:hypothetical protein
VGELRLPHETLDGRNFALRLLDQAKGDEAQLGAVSLDSAGAARERLRLRPKPETGRGRRRRPRRPPARGSGRLRVVSVPRGLSRPLPFNRTGRASMLLRLAGPIHEAVLPPDWSARPIRRPRHILAGAGHGGSRRALVGDAAPAAAAASWACERPDAQANRDHSKNECGACDHVATPATFAMVDASTWRQLSLNRAERPNRACASDAQCTLRKSRSRLGARDEPALGS